MVKTISPFGGVSAHGRFAGLVYQTGKYGQYCRALTPQRKRPTPAQLLQNYFFGVASDKWRLLTPEEKAVWNIQARGTKLTGFNLFIKKNIQHPGIAYYGIARYGIDRYSTDPMPPLIYLYGVGKYGACKYS